MTRTPLMMLALVLTMLHSACESDDGTNPEFVPPPDETGTVRPVLINACDVLTDDGMGALEAMGGVFAFGTRGSGQNRETCSWATEAFGRVDINVYLHSNSTDFRAAWEEDHSDSSDTSVVEWSPDGELRVVPSESLSVAAMWALVVNTDYVGRNVYIVARAYTSDDADGNPHVPAIASQKSALLSLGEVVSDAIWAAQPEGVLRPDGV